MILIVTIIVLTGHLQKVTEFFSPKIVTEVNDLYIKVAKIKGDKVPYHTHDNGDELFYILDGELTMEVEGRGKFTMHKGDIFSVPKGLEHRVYSEEECHIMLIEGKETEHTGNVESEITKSIEEQKY